MFFTLFWILAKCLGNKGRRPQPPFNKKNGSTLPFNEKGWPPSPGGSRPLAQEQEYGATLPLQGKEGNFPANLQPHWFSGSSPFFNFVLYSFAQRCPYLSVSVSTDRPILVRLFFIACFCFTWVLETPTDISWLGWCPPSSSQYPHHNMVHSGNHGCCWWWWLRALSHHACWGALP